MTWQGLPRWFSGKEPAYHTGDAGGEILIPGSGRSLGKGNGNPLQYSCLENLMGFPGGSDSKSPPAMQEMQVQSLGQEDPLEKEMATHFIILAWEIPWIEEPGGQQYMGLQKSWTLLRD